MVGFHVTTPKKLERYKQTGAILPPVRFWKWLASSKQWATKVNRSIILRIEVSEAYPLPDHQPRGHAYWSPNVVRIWDEL